MYPQGKCTSLLFCSSFTTGYVTRCRRNNQKDVSSLERPATLHVVVPTTNQRISCGTTAALTSPLETTLDVTATAGAVHDTLALPNADAQVQLLGHAWRHVDHRLGSGDRRRARSVRRHANCSHGHVRPVRGTTTPQSPQRQLRSARWAQPSFPTPFSFHLANGFCELK